MNYIKSIYKRMTSLHWEIGFLDNTYEDIVTGKDLRFQIVSHDFPKSWFADPFILDVTDSEIIVLVEEVVAPCTKGHITKLVIDKNSFHVKSRTIILERPGHLSFPVIYRNDNKIYVYPENSEDGSLNVYEYDPAGDTMTFVYELSEKPLTDAIYTELFGGKVLFTTDTDSPNGYRLDQYEWNESRKKFDYVTSVTFKEHIARMAGDFFKVGDKIYRPAQESNSNYGHGLSIQEVTYCRGDWSFSEIRRLVSPDRNMQKGFHTLNSYKGVMIVDIKGYRYRLLGPFLTKIVEFLKRI